MRVVVRGAAPQPAEIGALLEGHEAHFEDDRLDAYGEGT